MKIDHADVERRIIEKAAAMMSRNKEAVLARLEQLDSFKPTHRHANGNTYEVLCVAMHSETRELMVVYRNDSNIIWARPKMMFDDGRFTPIDDSLPTPEEV